MMSFWDKLRINFWNLLSYASLYGLSAYLIYKNFYEVTTVSKLKIGITFLFGVSVLVLIFLSRLRKKMKNQEIANAVAKKMGSISHDIRPEFEILYKLLKNILMIGLLIWFVYIIRFYGPGIYEVLIKVGLCIVLGRIFEFMAVNNRENIYRNMKKE